MTHKVDTLTFECAVRDPSSPLFDPEALAAALRRELGPTLDEVFGQVFGNGSAHIHAQFDRLEVDIGDFPADPDWTQVRAEFARRLRAGLAEFADARAGDGAVPASAAGPTSATARTDGLAGEDRAPVDQRTVRSSIETPEVGLADEDVAPPFADGNATQRAATGRPASGGAEPADAEADLVTLIDRLARALASGADADQAEALAAAVRDDNAAQFGALADATGRATKDTPPDTGGGEPSGELTASTADDAPPAAQNAIEAASARASGDQAPLPSGRAEDQRPSDSFPDMVGQSARETPPDSREAGPADVIAAAAPDDASPNTQDAIEAEYAATASATGEHAAFASGQTDGDRPSEAAANVAGEGAQETPPRARVAGPSGEIAAAAPDDAPPTPQDAAEAGHAPSARAAGERALPRLEETDDHRPAEAAADPADRAAQGRPSSSGAPETAGEIEPSAPDEPMPSVENPAPAAPTERERSAYDYEAQSSGPPYDRPPASAPPDPISRATPAERSSSDTVEASEEEAAAVTDAPALPTTTGAVDTNGSTQPAPERLGVGTPAGQESQGAGDEAAKRDRAEEAHAAGEAPLTRGAPDAPNQGRASNDPAPSSTTDTSAPTDARVDSRAGTPEQNAPAAPAGEHAYEDAPAAPATESPDQVGRPTDEAPFDSAPEIPALSAGGTVQGAAQQSVTARTNADVSSEEHPTDAGDGAREVDAAAAASGSGPPPTAASADGDGGDPARQVEADAATDRSIEGPPPRASADDVSSEAITDDMTSAPTPFAREGAVQTGEGEEAIDASSRLPEAAAPDQPTQSATPNLPRDADETGAGESAQAPGEKAASATQEGRDEPRRSADGADDPASRTARRSSEAAGDASPDEADANVRAQAAQSAAPLPTSSTPPPTAHGEGTAPRTSAEPAEPDNMPDDVDSDARATDARSTEDRSPAQDDVGAVAEEARVPSRATGASDEATGRDTPEAPDAASDDAAAAGETPPHGPAATDEPASPAGDAGREDEARPTLTPAQVLLAHWRSDPAAAERTLATLDVAALDRLLAATLPESDDAPPALLAAARRRAPALDDPARFLRRILIAVAVGVPVDLDALADMDAGAVAPRPSATHAPGAPGAAGRPAAQPDNAPASPRERIDALLDAAEFTASDAAALHEAVMERPELVAAALRPRGSRTRRIDRLLEATTEKEWQRIAMQLRPSFDGRDRIALDLLWERLPPSHPAAALAADGARTEYWRFALARLADPARGPATVDRFVRDAVDALAGEAGTPRSAFAAALLARLEGDRPADHAAAAAAVAATLRQLSGSAAPVAADSTDDAVDGALLTPSSGLILIARHLPMLFDRLGLLRERRFKDEEAVARALDVLHAAAFGNAPTRPYARPLERVLCGAPIDFPARPFLPLREEEADLVESLLGAVIEQWPAIGKTSPDGLREAFLQRDGLLESAEAGWRLKVDPKAYDMLLDRLPWPLSPVRLPWMPAPLHVSWRQ